MSLFCGRARQRRPSLPYSPQNSDSKGARCNAPRTAEGLSELSEDDDDDKGQR